MRCSLGANSPLWAASIRQWLTTYASRCAFSRRETTPPPITLFIASPGGSVAVCLERAASMGSIVFMGGDARQMAPHAELMIHDPLIPSGAGGSALALQETSRRLMQTRRTLTQILAERSGLSAQRIRTMTAKDTFLSAERALELGFATSVIIPGKDS